MTTPRFAAGTNIAMKLPLATYEATVRFYRDVLGLPVVEQDTSGVPTVARSHSLPFGGVTLWLDRVDHLEVAETWLEIVTDGLAASMDHLTAAGIETCDEVEPVPGLGTHMHWIRNPAGVIHLVTTSG